MPSWDDLRVFLALQRAGTLLGAGRALRVDHTTVGRRLAALEEELDGRLFERTPDGYALTPLGDRILAAAVAMEEQALAIDRQARGQDARLEGELRIATTVTFGAAFVVPRLGPLLRERHPDLTLEVVAGLSSFDLSRRHADLAIRMTRPSEKGLIVRQVATLAFGLYASPDYLDRRGRPRSPDALHGHDLIAYDRESPPNPAASWLEHAAAGTRTVLRGDQMIALSAAAAAGQGIAALPCFLAATEPRLESLGEPIASHAVWLVVHPDLQRSGRVRAAIDLLLELFERDAALLRGGLRPGASPAAARGYSRRGRSATRRGPARSRR